MIRRKQQLRLQAHLPSRKLRSSRRLGASYKESFCVAFTGPAEHLGAQRATPLGLGVLDDGKGVYERGAFPFEIELQVATLVAPRSSQSAWFQLGDEARSYNKKSGEAVRPRVGSNKQLPARHLVDSARLT